MKYESSDLKRYCNRGTDVEIRMSGLCGISWLLPCSCPVITALLLAKHCEFFLVLF